jgi:L-fuconolactonase|eukprot:TRINITY_DN70359_c0_g1_i1.p1 TRINITY_DN70359_c0_g1~~TRINITY_DN70359_c0_g1_i1.p1  ORF type:complete len:337 (-),score=61.31 TRINITY_DN70359_c0_g1_i1:35-967(-)
MEGVVDAHIHFSKHYSGGLQNSWHPTMSESFCRDWTEADYRACFAKSEFQVSAAIFVECFNTPPLEEAKWALRMVEDPNSLVEGVVAQIPAQKGAMEVNTMLDQLRDAEGKLPRGLKGARLVFMACENNTPEACLDATFLEGLEALSQAGLHWEFCCNPSMAPNLADCCSRFPSMTFIIDHLAHNGNDGGDMASWGPAIDALGKLPNVYAKMGAVEEWDVANPQDYMDRAIAAFGFDRVIYESNWFVAEAMGSSYDKTANLLKQACERAGASEVDLRKVFAENAKRVYSLDCDESKKRKREMSSEKADDM